MAGLGSILIADDEDTFLQSTARLLRREGYDCDCAADADEAIEMLSVRRYDLLLSDIRMPGNSDMRLFREVQRRAAGMPVILVTGHPSVDTAIESIRLAVAAYLIKPLDFEELRQRIHELLERSRTDRAVAAELLPETLDRVISALENVRKAFEPDELAELRTGLEQDREEATGPSQPARR